MIVVARSTSTSPRTKRSMRPSIRSLSICPWIDETRASGTSSARRRATTGSSRMRLFTTKTCPPRSISRRTASAIASSLSRPTTVSMACRPSGGVVRFEMSRMPSSAMCSVRGIGVAESVRMSTRARIALRRSFCLTPKRCSSSTITRPRFAIETSLREQPVRAHDDVHRAVRQSGQRPLVLARGVEAGERSDADRVGRQPLREDADVLLAEHLRGHEDRRLPPRADDLEQRAQRHLGLAVAHVAAEQPVHRLHALEVLAHGRGRGRLVGRVREREGVDELALPLGVRREGRGLALEARGLRRQQVPGEVLDGGGDLLLALPPLRAAELREPGRAAGAHVALDEVDPRDGHVHDRALGELDAQELAGPVPALERHEPAEEPDAVVEVHHRTADLELEEVLDGPTARPAARQPALAERHVREVVVGDVRRARRPEAERAAEAPAAERDLRTRARARRRARAGAPPRRARDSRGRSGPRARPRRSNASAMRCVRSSGCSPCSAARPSARGRAARCPCRSSRPPTSTSRSPSAPSGQGAHLETAPARRDRSSRRRSASAPRPSRAAASASDRGSIRATVVEAGR